MGCAESRQESSSQPFLPHFSDSGDDDDDNREEPTSIPSTMGQPPQIARQPLNGAAQLSSQHERLILELLPFKDARQFHEYVSRRWLTFPS